jgi:hypothetical protein
MESEGSLPRTQELSTFTYSETGQSTPRSTPSHPILRISILMLSTNLRHLKHDVSENGFCLHLQVETTHVNPIEEVHVSSFNLKTEKESILRNAVF